jgi:hypothetical protein
VTAIGADKVGIRIFPYGVFNATGPFDDIEAQFLTLTKKLSAMGLVYLHLVDHSAMGHPSFRPISNKNFAPHLLEHLLLWVGLMPRVRRRSCRPKKLT